MKNKACLRIAVLLASLFGLFAGQAFGKEITWDDFTAKVSRTGPTAGAVGSALKATAENGALAASVATLQDSGPQQAERTLLGDRKQSILNASYIYQGRNYRLELGDQLKITVLATGGAREILKKVSVDVFQSGWKAGFSQSRLLSCGVQEENDNVILDTTWQLGGPLREQATLKILFHLYPYYYKADYDVLYTGEAVNWGERGLRLFFGKDWQQGFSGQDAGLHVTFTPKEERLWQSGDYTVYVMPWKQYEQGQGAKFSMFVQPYVAGEPESIPAPAHLTGDPQDGLLGVNLAPTEQRNVFLGEQIPFVRLQAQNHAQEAKVLSWTLEASDFFHKKRFTQSGQISVPGEGAISQQQIQLPAWKGHINVKLAAQAGEERVEQISQLAVIPDPARAGKAQSPFGILLWGTNDLSLDLANWLGVHWIRYFNPAREDLSSYASRGLEPIPGADDLLKAPAGTFRLTEMANEPNFGYLAAEYAEKLKLSYLRQKKHDPNILVGSPSTAGADATWYRELAENGCWNYMDFIHVHLHCFPNAPEVDEAISSYYYLASRVKKLFPLMEEYGYKPVLDSEQGYLGLDPNVRVEGYGLGMVSDDDFAAAFLVRSYLEALAYGLVGKHWFTLNQYSGFGLFYYNTPRAGYSAYAVMTKMLDGVQYWGENVPDGGYFVPLGASLPPPTAPRVYQRVFKSADGSPLLVLWATLRRNDAFNESVDTEPWQGQTPGKDRTWSGEVIDREPEPVLAGIRVGTDRVRIVDLMGNERIVDCPDGRLYIYADDFPQYIFGAGESLLAAAAPYRYPRFSQTASPTAGAPVVQVLLPPGGTFLKRKGITDNKNIAAIIKRGEPAEFVVRITNTGERKVKGTITLELPSGWQAVPAVQTLCLMPESEDQDHILSAPFLITAPKNGTGKIRSVVHVEGMEIGDSVLNVSVTESGQ